MSGQVHIRAIRPCCIATALLAGLVICGAALAQAPDEGVLAQIFQAPITSSATGRPQLASEAPANIEIITQDDIRRSGATTIPDALEFLPGVYVRRYGIADVDVGIRGYDQPYNPRLLVLVNGREVYEQAYGDVPWSEIPVQLEEIRQIEVIKGPNSALYGFNAVSGVINIITYDPLTDTINAATVRGGTQSYLSGSVVGTGQIGAGGRCQAVRRRDAGERLRARGARPERRFGSAAAANHDIQYRRESPSRSWCRDLYRSERGRYAVCRGRLRRHLRHHVPAHQFAAGWRQRRYLAGPAEPQRLSQ